MLNCEYQRLETGVTSPLHPLDQDCEKIILMLDMKHLSIICSIKASHHFKLRKLWTFCCPQKGTMWHRIIYDASFAFLSDNMNPNLGDVTLSWCSVQIQKNILKMLIVHYVDIIFLKDMLEQNLLQIWCSNRNALTSGSL